MNHLNNFKKVVSIILLVLTFSCKTPEEKSIIAFVFQQDPQAAIDDMDPVDTLYFKNRIPWLAEKIKLQRIFIKDSIDKVIARKRLELKMYASVYKELSCNHDRSANKQLQDAVKFGIDSLDNYNLRLASEKAIDTPLEPAMAKLHRFTSAPDSVEAYIYRVTYKHNAGDSILFVSPALKVDTHPFLDE